MINFDNIPQELKQRRQWTPTKRKRAFISEWQKPENYFTFADAVEKSSPYPGLILGDSVFCLDFDRVLSKDGKTKSPGFVEMLKVMKEKAGPTFVERSASGRGYHFFYKADIPNDAPFQHKITLGPIVDPSDVDKDGRPNGNRLELYTGNGKGKYIAMTGNRAGKTTTLADGSALLSYLLEQGKKAASKQKKENAGGADERPSYLSVDEIPVKIRASASGELFKRLYDEGDYSAYDNDNSAAAQALINLLPFWCGGNPQIMWEVFAQCELGQRPEAERKARKYDIPKALADWDGECYTPEYGRSSPDDDFEDLDKDPDIISRPQWPVMEKTDKGSRAIKQAWENTDYLLKALSITCRYNMLTKEVEFTGHDLEGLSLEAAATVVRGIMYKNGLKVSRADLMDNIGTVAEKNRYSPVQDYLKVCQVLWDGQDHIKEFFQHLHIAPAFKENTDFYEMLFRRWLIGAARIAFNDGTEAMQGVIVLRGPQGVGKSRLLYNLLPNPAWGADGVILDPGIKDDLLKVTRVFIVELAEVGETLRKEKTDRIKAFITQKADDLRRPYRRTTEKLPRTTAFIATVTIF